MLNIWLCWARYIYRYPNIFYMMNEKVKREIIVVLQFFLRTLTGRVKVNDFSPSIALFSLTLGVS